MLEQAESADRFQRTDRFHKRFNFLYLYAALGYRGVMDYLGTSSEGLRSAHEEPVPPDRLDNLGRLRRWLFGDKTRDRRPLISFPESRSSRPERNIGNRGGQGRAGEWAGFEAGLWTLPRVT